MQVRDGHSTLDAAMTDALLAGVDKLGALVGELPATGDAEIDAELAALNRLDSGEVPEVPTTPKGVIEITAAMLDEAHRFCQRVYIAVLPAQAGGDSALRERLSAQAEVIAEAPGADGACSIAFSAPLSPDGVEEALGLQSEWVREVTEPVAAQGPEVPTPAPTARRAGKVESADTVRVPVRLLDKLMALAGELVLSRNQLLQSVAVHADPATQGVLQNLDTSRASCRATS